MIIKCVRENRCDRKGIKEKRIIKVTGSCMKKEGEANRNSKRQSKKNKQNMIENMIGKR